MCGRYEYHPYEFSDLRIRFNLDKDLPEFKRSYKFREATTLAQLAE